MTDAQAAALIAAIPVAAGTLGALIRSAAVIFRDAKLETTTRWENALKESNAVIRENSATFASLMRALGVVDARTQDVGARVVEIHRETSDVYSVPVPPMPAQPMEPMQPIEREIDPEDTPLEIPQSQTVGRTPTRERARSEPGANAGRRTPPRGSPVTAGMTGPTQPRPASSPYSITNPKRRGE